MMMSLTTETLHDNETRTLHHQIRGPWHDGRAARLWPLQEPLLGYQTGVCMYVFKEKSNDELLDMGIAPVARQYWLQGVPLTVKQAEITAEPSKKLSRRQLKKEKRTKAFCFNFARNLCERGENCKYSHEVDAFAKTRKSDLHGSCPYTSYKSCPFGVLCRWAASHAIKDELTETTLRLQASADRGNPGQDASNGLLVGNLSNITNATACEELPILPELLPPTNTLEKDLQQKLWKKQFDFSLADRLVEELRSGKHCTYCTPGIQNKHEAAPENQSDEPPQKRQKASLDADPQNSQMKNAPGQSVTASEKAELRGEDLHMNGVDQAGGSVLAAAERSSEAAAEQGRDGLQSVEQAAHSLETNHRGEAGVQSLQLSREDQPAALGSNSAEPPNDEALLYDVRDHNDWANLHKDTPLKPNEKKALDLKGKLYLAPLTTVGNLPFRRLCKGLGADITCGEMAVATNLLQGQASEWALLKRDSTEDIFGVQICGGYPDHMTRCAAVLEENIDVDFVDINMGCPIDVICCKGAGSALLQRPNRMEQVVRGVSTILSCPLTVKVRRGYNDGQDIAHQILPCVKEWGASAATLHGRSRQQRYSREADWEYIAKCASAAAPLPLVGNGDIFAWTDYDARIQQIPELATTMIARGALIKPWIFTEIKEKRHWDISASERLDLLKLFCSSGLIHWGSDEKGVETTRRFLLEWLSYLCRYIPVGLLEVVPQKVGWRPPLFKGRSDLETLLSSFDPEDWIKISEMLLGPVPEGFSFQAKHKSNAYAATEKSMAFEGDQENG